MRWKINSRIKNLIAMLPDFIGDNVYYFIQRKFGGLKKSETLYLQNIAASKKIWTLIILSKKEPRNKVFFELGTGRVPEVPFYLWLTLNSISTVPVLGLIWLLPASTRMRLSLPIR